jgi:hypothetical protein
MLYHDYLGLSAVLSNANNEIRLAKSVIICDLLRYNGKVQENVERMLRKWTGRPKLESEMPKSRIYISKSRKTLTVLIRAPYSCAEM